MKIQFKKSFGVSRILFGLGLILVLLQVAYAQSQDSREGWPVWPPGNSTPMATRPSAGGVQISSMVTLFTDLFDGNAKTKKNFCESLKKGSRVCSKSIIEQALEIAKDDYKKMCERYAGFVPPKVDVVSLVPYCTLTTFYKGVPKVDITSTGADGLNEFCDLLPDSASVTGRLRSDGTPDFTILFNEADDGFGLCKYELYPKGFLRCDDIGGNGQALSGFSVGGVE